MSDAHEQILRKLLHRIAGEQQYEDYDLKITQVTTDGANYTSMLFHATITAPNKPDLKLFAKVAAVGEKFRSQMMTQIFDVEHYTYTTLAKIFERIQDKYQLPAEERLVMPKFYGYDGTYLEETLVLQDLTAEGFAMPDRLEAMGWEFAVKSLEELAKMHALSIVFQEEYPEEFEEATKVFKTQNFEEMMVNGTMGEMMQQMSNRTIAAVGEEYRERLQALFERFQEESYWRKFFGPQKRPVLVHGDFKTSNVMCRQREYQLDIVLLDYQCVHVGAGMTDVLFFLLPSTDEEFRLKHFQQLLDHYYGHVCLMLRRMRQEPERLFPREDYDAEVETNLPWGYLVALFVLPVVTVAAENAPKIDDDLGLQSLTSIQSSDLYEARVRGIVRDCVRLGVI